MRAADASFGHHGELLCDGCAVEQNASAAPLGSSVEQQGSDRWATLRLALIGLQLMLVLTYLLLR